MYQTPVIPAPNKEGRKKDQMSKANLDYKLGPCLKEQISKVAKPSLGANPIHVRKKNE